MTNQTNKTIDATATDVTNVPTQATQATAPQVMTNPAQVPAYAQTKGGATLDDIAVGGGLAVPRVSLKNNIISILADGATVATFGNEADILVVGAQPGFGRIYYGKQYSADSTGDLPVCWSEDGKMAAEAAPQCPSPDRSCAACPMNVKGSATNGKGKACQYVKNLAVLFLNDPVPGRLCRLSVKGGTLFGPDFPDKGIYNFKNFGQYMQSLNVQNISGAIVRIFFDTSPTATPNKLLFVHTGWVDEQFATQYLFTIPDEQIEQATSMDFGQAWEARNNAESAGHQPPQPVPQAAPQPVPQPAPAAPQAAPQPAPAAPQAASQPAPAAPQPAPAEPQAAPQETAQAAPQPAPAAPQQQEEQKQEAPAASAEAMAEALKQFGVDL